MKKIQLLTIVTIVFFMISPNITVVKAIDYKFPWPKGYSWNWNQGWHYNGYNYAIDVGTSNTNKFVLAAADGTVSQVCTDTRSNFVVIDHADGFTMMYAHIELGKLESNITQYATVQKGQVLGFLKAGDMAAPDPGCGIAYQDAAFGHIHWTFEGGAGKTIEGWTLSDYSTSTFINGASIKYAGNNLPVSTNIMLLRNGTVSSNKNYETLEEIRISGDGNGFNINPSGSNQITIKAL